MYCVLNCCCCSRDIIIIVSALRAYDGLLACRRVRKPKNKKNLTVFTDFCFTPITLVLIIIILSSVHAAVVAVYYIRTPKVRIYRGYTIYIYTNVQRRRRRFLCTCRRGIGYYIYRSVKKKTTQNFNVISRDLPRIIRGAHTHIHRCTTKIYRTYTWVRVLTYVRNYRQGRI